MIKQLRNTLRRQSEHDSRSVSVVSVEHFRIGERCPTETILKTSSLLPTKRRRHWFGRRRAAVRRKRKVNLSFWSDYRAVLCLATLGPFRLENHPLRGFSGQKAQQHVAVQLERRTSMSESQARKQAADPEWQKIMRKLVTQSSRKGIDANHYHSGFPAMDEEEWTLAIALEEKKNGNSLFENWLPHQQLPKYLREWCEEEFQKLVHISILKRKVYDEAAKNKDGLSPSYLKRLYSQIPLVPQWSSRTAEGRVKWKSAHTNAPNVTIGVAPENGISGGHKYEDTLSCVFDVITPRAKAEVQGILAERIAVRPDLFPDKSEDESWLKYVQRRWLTWRQKVRKLLRYFGGGLWGTWNQKAKNTPRKSWNHCKTKPKRSVSKVKS